MTFYKKFLEDLEIHREYEIHASSLVENYFNTETLLNTDEANYKYYDFKDRKGMLYEVKADKRSLTTPNFYIEYEAFQKPSGISITRADYYVITNTKQYYLVPTEAIRQLIDLLHPKQVSCHNGRGISRGYLIPQEKIREVSILL